jgi:DNA-binding transcriptional LysR family regulator
MNISQLRTFLAVVDHGSFSAAAKDLGISQPAVTMQLQALEADLGVTLLDRRYRRIDLTEAGRLLEPHARRTVSELDGAREELAGLSDDITGDLQIVASTTPGAYVIPRVLGGFLSECPNVRVVITERDTADVVDAVEAGAAQLGVCGAVVKGAKAEFEALATDEIVAICPPDSPWASQAQVPLSELAGADWVAREQGSGTRRVVESALAERGVDPSALRVVAELGAGEAIVSAVEGGLGVAMLSRFVAEKALAAGTVARIDIEGPPFERPFYIVIPKGTPTRAALAFRTHLLASLGV